jgi:hypothetical protein
MCRVNSYKANYRHNTVCNYNNNNNNNYYYYYYYYNSYSINLLAKFNR